MFNGQPLPFSLPINQEPTIELQNIVLNESISSIDLEWHSGGVKITKSSDDRIRIIEKSSVQLDESKWVKPVVDGDRLVLHSRNKNNFVFFFFQSSESYLELQLPEQVYTSFKARLTSGTHSISNFDFNQFDLTMTSGSLQVNKVNSEDIQILMTSGNAYFNQVETNNLDINMTSGNTNFTGSVSNALNIEITSGNIDLDTSDDSPNQLSLDMTSGVVTLTLSEDEGFQVSIDKTSGSFSPDSRLNRLNDSLYQHLDYKLNYSVEMTSGSLSIRLK